MAALAAVETGFLNTFLRQLHVSAHAGAVQNASAARPVPDLPFARLRPDTAIPVELVPGGAVTKEAIWIPQRHPSGVVRLDPKNGTADRPIALSHAPCASMVSAFRTLRPANASPPEPATDQTADNLWVALCDAGTIARVDVAHRNVTARVPLRVAHPEGSIAVAAASLWAATDERGIVSRIDPATNAPVGEAFVAAEPFGVAAAEEAVWVTSEAGDLLTRLDANTNVVVETIKVGPRPGRLATGEGAVWTLNRGDGSVTRVDQKSNKVLATIAVGESVAGGDIAVGEGAAWLSAPGIPIVRIDARTNRVTHRFTGEGGGAILVGHGSVWVAAGVGQTWRIDPKLIAALRP